MDAEQRRNRVERALETFNDQAFDEHMDLFAPGATFTDPVLDEPVSGDAHRAYLDSVVEAFPDLEQQAEAIYTADGTVVVESRFTGTHEGPLEGVPPTGNSVDVPLASVIELSDEGITDWQDYWDQQTFREQLGLTVPAVFGQLPGMVAWLLRERV